MDTVLKYSAMPSLKEISLKKVTIILWNQPDILASLEETGIESKVEDKIGKLELPAELIEQIKYLVKPIGADIRNWKKFHEVYLQIDNIEMLSFVKKLCWINSVGGIDYKKTAENMILSKMFKRINPYKLACLYCLEDYIPVIWEKISVYCKGPNEENSQAIHEEPPFWPYVFETEVQNSYTMYGASTTQQNCSFEFKFNLSAVMGNKVATEYFYEKLPSETREDLLLRTISLLLNRPTTFNRMFMYKFPKEKFGDNLIYLLSLARPEKQLEFLKSNPRRILQFFLDWPRQDLFLDIAKFIWTFIDANDYVFLLVIIANKIQSGYYFAEIFQEFFSRGSRDFIKYFMEIESRHLQVLDILFKAHLSETVKLIFKKLDSKYRKSFIFSRGVFDFFNDSFLTRQLGPVLLCLHEAALSEEEKEELKRAFFGHLNVTVKMPESSKENIRELFLQCLFENHMRLPCKRKIED